MDADSSKFKKPDFYSGIHHSHSQLAILAPPSDKLLIKTVYSQQILFPHPYIGLNQAFAFLGFLLPPIKIPEKTAMDQMNPVQTNSSGKKI